MELSVFGLGKLGSPMAAVLAGAGHRVIGVDVNPVLVNSINAGQAPVEEPGLQELLDAHRSQLSATMDYHQAISKSSVSFIIVPTPSKADGKFTNQYVLEVVEKIGQVLKNKNTYHLIVITSTVMPGSTGGEIQRTLEKAAGRPVGETIGLCYSPEFVALGNVVENMLYPDFVLIGESDRRAGDLLEAVYRSYCKNDVMVQRMNFVNAELTKISVNTYVTTKISYANMLSDICDRLPEADVDVVSRAVGCDTRIGHRYLRGAVAYGGPCFPRDNIAFAAMTRDLGACGDLAVATDKINHYQTARLLNLIQGFSGKKTVSILGLAYKPNVAVIERSQGITLANLLIEKNYAVKVYDPMALPAAKKELHSTVELSASLEACAHHSDILVILMVWKDMAPELTQALQRNTQDCIVIDCWRTLAVEKMPPTVNLVHLGAGALASELEENVALVGVA